MRKVILRGIFGNGKDHVAWVMETDPEQIDALTARYRLERGVIRRVESAPVVFFYLLAEWEEVGG